MRGGFFVDAHLGFPGQRVFRLLAQMADQADGAREHADARWQSADDWVTSLRAQVRR